jgi:hypothetical protein
MNDYSTATNMGTATTKTETGLACNTGYTRYIWAYNGCGNSSSTSLTQSISAPSPPASGTNQAFINQVVWTWSAVAGATGYKWNTVNDYSSATDMGATTTKTETGLACITIYNRYLWAYNACGNSQVTLLTQTTKECCPQSLTIQHISAGGVAPVNKTTTYGIVTDIPGEPTKCWITSNLGSDHQATAVWDATEPSAGWYWQFNHKQGFKHDGTTRTPNTTWIAQINENTDWQSSNDPCSLELGTKWRLPTITELSNVNISGGWNDWNGAWNSNLKLHAAGYLGNPSGMLFDRGVMGLYWSSSQYNTDNARVLDFYNSFCDTSYDNKSWGFSVRCLRDN